MQKRQFLFKKGLKRRMIEKLRQWEKYFDPVHVRLGNGSKVNITETEESGSGTATLSVEGDYVFLKGCAGRHQIIWLNHHKCADGGVITFSQQDVVIHVVELKSTVRIKEWKKARQQFSGMLLNSLALLGCAGLPDNIKVKCYLAYRADAMTPARSASPIFGKKLPDLKMPETGYEGWDSSFIELPFGIVAEFSKHKRDEDGNVTI